MRCFCDRVGMVRCPVADHLHAGIALSQGLYQLIELETGQGLAETVERACAKLQRARMAPAEAKLVGSLENVFVAVR